MKKSIKIITFLLLSVGIICLGVSSYAFAITKNANLDESKLLKSEYDIFYYDDNGTLISPTFSQKNYVTIDKLSSFTKNAFICTEDKRFYKHKGIDYKRILGAIKNNILSLSLKEGASTISQQLVKNTHLSGEKTFNRKLKEIKITYELEKKYTKDEILEKYLNTIYFGGGAYGIENASLLYFGKSACDLSLVESCTLAGIIKSPKKYSPIINYDNANKRKNLILDIMFKENCISKSDYLNGKNESIILNSTNNCYNDYIDAVNVQFDELNLVNNYSNKDVKIYTYLDKKLQGNLVDLLSDDYLNKQIVINTKNNGVIAYFGKYSNQKRNPASCIKPWYIYAPMINDNKLTESTIILDEKISYNGYEPSNYGNKYYGYVTAKTSLANSLNIPAVKLLDSYGIDKANSYAKKLGVNVNGKDLTTALGVTENGLTLKELCDCYSPFSNKGIYNKSSFIKKIVVGDKIIYQNTAKNDKVFSEDTAFIVNDMLKECVKTGTAKKLGAFNFDICAKTGTNGNKDGNLDAYCVSYTTNHIVGVWLGANEKLMPNTISGATLPTMTCREIVNKLYKDYYPLNFEMPSNTVLEKINAEELYKNQRTYLANFGEDYLEFYYKKNNKPTTYYKDIKSYKINDIIVNIKNNSICIKCDYSGYNGIKISREINGKTTMVYEGESNNFVDKNLNVSGKYRYSIIPYKIENGNKIYYEKYVTSYIKFNKNTPNFDNNKWWIDN